MQSLNLPSAEADQYREGNRRSHQNRQPARRRGSV
jgi:hypothetical protein